MVSDIFFGSVKEKSRKWRETSYEARDLLGMRQKTKLCLRGSDTHTMEGKRERERQHYFVVF